MSAIHSNPSRMRRSWSCWLAVEQLLYPSRTKVAMRRRGNFGSYPMTRALRRSAALGSEIFRFLVRYPALVVSRRAPFSGYRTICCYAVGGTVS